MEYFTITVRRKGVTEIAYREEYAGSSQQAERRASDIWSRPEYSSGSADGRFQLKLHRKGDTKPFMTIG